MARQKPVDAISDRLDQDPLQRFLLDQELLTKPLASWRAIASDILARLDIVDPDSAERVLAGEVVRAMPLSWYELATSRTFLESVRISDNEILERRTQNLWAPCTLEFCDGLPERWGERREDGNGDE